jgi:hypothetical protein
MDPDNDSSPWLNIPWDTHLNSGAGGYFTSVTDEGWPKAIKAHRVTGENNGDEPARILEEAMYDPDLYVPWGADIVPGAYLQIEISPQGMVVPKF